MNVTDYVSIASLAFAIISFIISLAVRRQTRKSEQNLEKIAREAAAKTAVIQALQGEKESIGFTALHFLSEGLPRDDSSYRVQILESLVQAAIFSGSDRARAMVYSVLRDNYHEHGSEIDKAVASVENLFKQFEQFQLN